MKLLQNKNLVTQLSVSVTKPKSFGDVSQCLTIPVPVPNRSYHSSVGQYWTVALLTEMYQRVENLGRNQVHLATEKTEWSYPTGHTH